MRIKKVLGILAASAAIAAGACPKLHAAGGGLHGAPVQMECTAYYEGEVTASGQEVRPGVCAGKREWLGLTCIVYEDDGGRLGDYIGIYEILDTGGEERVRKGECIDIYMQGEEECMEWGRRKVWVLLVEADG